ncbi:MAG: hypothetical protein ACFE9Z_02845 [Promethearchaeota archaeon]
MEEKKEDDFDQKFDDEELDLTKDAFFADLMDMEEEIANEAYELVEHAMNLVNSKYYNDSVEILRQAIGLYTQINREEEIKAINEKISEIYILKETTFMEVESAPEEEPQIIEETEVIEEVEEKEEADFESDMLKQTDQLIVKAHQLVNENKFEEALDKYDQAEKILEKLGKPEEIERLYLLIEECYNKKADHLRSVKKEEPEKALEAKLSIGKDTIKEEKLKQFLESKKREEEISAKAYEVLDKAVEMTKRKDYDQAIKFYKEGVNLFEQINWSYEAKRIRDTIDELEKEKVKYFEALEQQKLESTQITETEVKKEKLIEQHVEELSEQEKAAQMERLRGIELQKMEQEFFKAQIDNMATEAARMAREYELSIQKAIKDGDELEECMYPKVIEIYKRIKELLVDKGWIKEAAIYDDTIDVYIQKFEQDKKVRQIEIEKVKRKQEAEEFLKVKQEVAEIGDTKELRRLSEEQRQKAIDIQNLKKQFDEMTKRAERLSREYEVALRQGKFELKCPYPEIINNFEKLREIAAEKGWETDVTIFSSQIYNYKKKLEKDDRLRQIETDKAKKQEELEEVLKTKKQEPSIELNADRIKTFKEKSEREKEEEDFDNILDVMINRAEKMAREYEVSMKKAIKEGKLAENPPFLKIIGIYERVKRMLLDKGREREALIYNNQIKFYTQKLEKDNKLREVEAKKAQREKALEEMHLLGKEIGLDEKRLKSIEKRKEEENFEKYITENVNNAEKMVRDYEMAMRKAYRKGEILENTPYQDVNEIYKDLMEKVQTRGWGEQAEIYWNQIKIYQDKLEKHKKLLEIEAQKIQKEKSLEKMQKVEKEVETDTEKLKAIELQKEDEEFQKMITNMVNKAEKIEREYDSAMKKAIKKGKVIEETPYHEIIEIYDQIKNKLIERGWVDQSRIYINQIKMYQDKLQKHDKLLEIEAQKIQREKLIEEMQKVEREVEIDTEKLKAIEFQKEDEEFQKLITNMVNKAGQIEREYDSAMKKAIKKGKVIEETPYHEIIEIYDQIKNKLIERGWVDQSQIYINQIKMYQDKLQKHDKLLEIEAKKAKREQEIEQLHKVGKKEVTPAQPEKIKELEGEEKEEDLLLDKAMKLIDEAEKAVKSYELSIRKDILVYESPYENAISNYEEAKKIFNEIGWNDEANRLINTIKFYKDKQEKDDKLRVIEQKKLEKEAIKPEVTKIIHDRDFIERQKRLLEIQQKEKDADEKAANIFDMIQNAERMAQEYELKLKEGIFDFEAPYEKIIDIYRKARKEFEKIGWEEESAKLINTINFYKEKSIKDTKIRAIEAEKIKKREEELTLQQRLLEQAREEKERLIKKRKESLDLKKERVAQFETQKDRAFRLMDQAKRELRKNSFDAAIELYKESEEVFKNINWQEGIKMVRDSIAMIKGKKEAFELEKQAIEQRKIEAIKIEEKIEEKLVEAQIMKRKQQEEKRKEFLRIQKEKEQERLTSEEAYMLLEEGTKLMDHGKFIEAQEKYLSARELFEKISWHREVSRINNDLLFKLKREQKQAEILEEIKLKKIEEEKQIIMLREETKREKEELERKKKEEKRKLARQELDRKIRANLEKADKLIDNLQYNQGILILKNEIQRLSSLGKENEIEDIKAQINEVKSKTEVPLIILDASEEDFQNANFNSAYKALDEAQVSITNNFFKKAISELKEAKYNLKKLKLTKDFLDEIEKKIDELKVGIGKKPKEIIGEPQIRDEKELLRERIATRREERRRKVLELLGKGEE